MAIKLRLDVFNDEINRRGWTDLQAAQKIGVSPVQLWRLRLPDNDPRHNDPGESFIEGAIRALGKTFDELFFLEPDLRARNDKEAPA